MTATTAQDVALSQLLLWVLLGEIAVLLPIVLAVAVTVHVNYDRWLILRSRGVWYTRVLSWGPLVQFALSLALALTCVYAGWTAQSAGLAVLGAVEETWLFFLTGAVIARQFILALVFNTLPGRRRHRGGVATYTTMGPNHFLLVPLAVTLIWIVFGEVPQQLMAFGVLPAAITSTITYLAVAAVVLLYAVPAFANRSIPMVLFCDYRANVLTFVILVIVSIGISCLNGIYLFPQGYLLALRVARSCAYVVVAAMYTIINFAVPAWAVWTGNTAYLQLHEDAIREVKLIVPSGAAADHPSQPHLDTVVMERITVRIEAEGSGDADSTESPRLALKAGNAGNEGGTD